MRAALALLLFACSTEPMPDPPVAPERPAGTRAPSGAPVGWAPTEAEQRALDRLAVRHPEPSCAEVAALVDDPLSTWRNVVTHVEAPPWVPMRAAGCLLAEHPDEAEADALRWVSDPETRGLTVLVLGRLDEMPIERAQTIGRAALAGPHAEIARARLRRLETPELRELAEP